MLVQRRPEHDADPMEWIKFHHRNAGIYAHVMLVDPRFALEASVYSCGELRIARELDHRHKLTYVRGLHG
jgi:hypothetical protein